VSIFFRLCSSPLPTMAPLRGHLPPLFLVLFGVTALMTYKAAPHLFLILQLSSSTSNSLTGKPPAIPAFLRDPSTGRTLLADPLSNSSPTEVHLPPSLPVLHSAQGRSTLFPLVACAGLLAALATALSSLRQRRRALTASAWDSSVLAGLGTPSEWMAITVAAAAEDCGCPPGRTVDVLGTPVDAALLRAQHVAGVDGSSTTIGALAGDGKAVVVFLRHLACPYCWKLANRWLEFRDPLRAAGVRGPLFVSVGNNDNLRAFLQANPHFPSDSVFVDTKDLAAYKAVGFKKLFEVTPKPTGLPGLSGDQWRTYLSNLQSLLPFGNERDPAAVSDGVRQLGGTFVLNGNDVVYGWADRVPGDDPDPTDVLRQAGIPF
jgi:hypothetical protein